MKRNSTLVAGVMVAILAFIVLNKTVREGFSQRKLAYAENEGATVNITAPDGLVITDVLFASYGNPTGSNGDFQKGSCHASTSEQVVKDRCVGKRSCSIPASNGVFGDPCYGTTKRLYVTVNANTPPTTSTGSSTPSTGSSTPSTGSSTPSTGSSTPATTTPGTTSSSTPSITPSTTLPPSTSTLDWTTIGIIGGIVLVIVGAMFIPLGGSPSPRPVVVGARRVK